MRTAEEPAFLKRIDGRAVSALLNVIEARHQWAMLKCGSMETTLRCCQMALSYCPAP